MVKHSFAIAGVVTFVVFSAGMLLQWNLDQMRTGDILERVGELELTTNSLFVERELVGLFGYKECSIHLDRSKEIAKKVDKMGGTLESYKDSNLFQEEKYVSLKHQYSLLEIFYWSKLLGLKESCNKTDYVTVLYFYEEKCDLCRDQGIVLTEVKREYDEAVMIFSLDADFSEVDANIRMLIDEYNITAVPSIIIDKDLKLSGFVSRGRLKEIVDSRLG